MVPLPHPGSKSHCPLHLEQLCPHLAAAEGPRKAPPRLSPPHKAPQTHLLSARALQTHQSPLTFPRAPQKPPGQLPLPWRSCSLPPQGTQFCLPLGLPLSNWREPVPTSLPHDGPPSQKSSHIFREISMPQGTPVPPYSTEPPRLITQPRKAPLFLFPLFQGIPERYPEADPVPQRGISGPPIST